jgi:hypothetical protein
VDETALAAGAGDAAGAGAEAGRGGAGRDGLVEVGEDDGGAGGDALGIVPVPPSGTTLARWPALIDGILVTSTETVRTCGPAPTTSIVAMLESAETASPGSMSTAATVPEPDPAPDDPDPPTCCPTRPRSPSPRTRQ